MKNISLFIKSINIIKVEEYKEAYRMNNEFSRNINHTFLKVFNLFSTYFEKSVY